MSNKTMTLLRRFAFYECTAVRTMNTIEVTLTWVQKPVPKRDLFGKVSNHSLVLGV